ncbi:acyl-CoA N-acyltransferase domain-containing protein [Pectobacterium phage POP72]|uniref:Acyl-CoA N-acyltransferase domain-containing protein n=2 Tax=Axomammavirus PP1 TaxID=2733578 RepID=I7FXT0_9CAUD|nr:acetyltransferase [Pectobacterium phage PP1]AFP33692.1 acyl-CoA N-acyltransferase domain-containing protein [Pectobacterium phage PP1]ARB10950.1 acyl-CoA N-acyltransferase domain-containing protein [Pectobacterium phage POP72]
MILREATYFDVPELLRSMSDYMDSEVKPQGHHCDEWSPELAAHNLMCSIKNPTETVTLAIEDGRLVGYIWAAAHQLGPWSHTLVSSDYLFYVHPDYRGSLAAYRLMKAYKLWAVELGCKEVRLSVASGIHPERTGKLYERMGFTLFALTYNYVNRSEHGSN